MMLDEQATYRRRTLPDGCVDSFRRERSTLELLPAATHPMDVLRTGYSMLGAALPEGVDHSASGARQIADRLLASCASMLLYWHHYSHEGRRLALDADDDSIGGHFLRVLNGRSPTPVQERAMHTSLILYAEHEYNASTFTARIIAGTGSDIYSATVGAIGGAERTETRWRERGGLRRDQPL